MSDLVNLVMTLASETWTVLVAGFVIILALVMLAHSIRATVAVGTGSGSGLGQAIAGLVGPALAGLFLFLAVPPLIQSMTAISSCTSTLADLTTWSQRLLGIFLAFRMLKVSYMAVVAEAIGSGEAAAMLLNEAAAVVAAILFIPFLSGVASIMLGC